MKDAISAALVTRHELYLTDKIAKPLANSSVRHGEAANWAPSRLSNPGTGVEEGVAYGLA